MRVLSLAGLVFVGLLVCGCGPRLPLVRVWGEVSFDGKPIEQGDIAFTPLEGSTGQETGGAIEDGRYDVPQWLGLVAGGTYKVQIRGLAPTGRTIPGAVDSEGRDIETLDNYIPPKYNSQSTLKVTIPTEGSDHRLDFDLESERPA